LNTPQIDDAIQLQRGRLGDQGRLLIRPSGTEPLIRVMAEGDDRDLIHSVVDELIDLIATAAS
jgi:phosphoglucosamine mutase